MRRLGMVVLLAGLAFPAVADVVKTKDGRTLEGTIVEETDEQVVLEIERSIGKVRTAIARKNIVSLERTRGAREEYAERRAGAADADWGAHLALAQWCLTKDLKAEAGRHALHVLTKAAESPEARDAKRLAHKLGYREYPEEGWLLEDDYWGPKGFQRWKGAWATKEYALADRAYDVAREELDKLRKRADYQAGVLGEHAAEYNPLAAEHEQLAKRLDELNAAASKEYDAATAALGRTSTVTLTEAEMHTLVQDAYGNWLTVDGTLVARSDQVNIGAWQEFWAHQRALKSIAAEREKVVRRMNWLAAQMNAIAAKARKSGARADTTAREGERAEARVEEAEARRDEAKAAMDARLGEDGLVKRAGAGAGDGGSSREGEE